MPIEIHAVTKEEFEEWLVKAKEEFAYDTNMAPIHYAMNDAVNNLVIEGVR
jgi:heme/copper-type cytochrome/quinol oxidase subunit 2